MTRATIAVAGVALACASQAHAQSVPLPRIDAISFYGEIGDLETAEAKNLSPGGVDPGWGLETDFTVAASDSHVIELALGYDQTLEHFVFTGTHGAGYVFAGELRDLPSVSVYATFPCDVYVGLSSGLVSLANATATGAAERFAVTGDTFDAAAKIGYAIPFQPHAPLEDQRVYGFIEADYHARYFGGVSYVASTVAAPTDLPTRMYLGGATLSIGIQVTIHAEATKAASARAKAMQ